MTVLFDVDWFIRHTKKIHGTIYKIDKHLFLSLFNIDNNLENSSSLYFLQRLKGVKELTWLEEEEGRRFWSEIPWYDVEDERGLFPHSLAPFPPWNAFAKQKKYGHIFNQI